jgi:hypothetical protein
LGNEMGNEIRSPWRRLVRAAERPGQRDKYDSVTITSGEAFVEESDDEAARLIASGAARQKPLPLPPPPKPAGSRATSQKRQAAGGDPLDKLTDAELAAMAKDRNVALDAGATRVDIIAAINKAAAA